MGKNLKCTTKIKKTQCVMKNLTYFSSTQKCATTTRSEGRIFSLRKLYMFLNPSSTDAKRCETTARTKARHFLITFHNDNNLFVPEAEIKTFKSTQCCLARNVAQ